MWLPPGRGRDEAAEDPLLRDREPDSSLGRGTPARSRRRCGALPRTLRDELRIADEDVRRDATTEPGGRRGEPRPQRPTVLPRFAEHPDGLGRFPPGLELLVEQEGRHKGLPLLGDGEQAVCLPMPGDPLSNVVRGHPARLRDGGCGERALAKQRRSQRAASTDPVFPERMAADVVEVMALLLISLLSRV